MAETSWDDVGNRFTELGQKLQDAWEQGRADDQARADLQSAGEKVKAALDDVAETINRAAGSPEIRDAAREATASIADALSTTLHQVAERIERPRPKG